MNRFFLKILDTYIIKKFLGTFFLALVLIIAIAVVFDFSEKIDNFMEQDTPFYLIFLKYYPNYIPYLAVLFSSFFVFISVVFITSKLAYNTEIVAILSNGVSFRRLMVPYIISAIFITLLTTYLNQYVVPQATEVRLRFEDKYYHKAPPRFSERNIHRQIEPGVFIYMENYSNYTNTGDKFSLERFKDGVLKSKLIADHIRWDKINEKWIIKNYYIRKFQNGRETIEKGTAIDTSLNIHPSDFARRSNVVKTMTLPELNSYIDEQRMQGTSQIELCLVEKHKRYAYSFSTIILTIIGVSISSRKLRGGMGMHLGIGLLITFSYILFMQFSAQFAIGGSIKPIIAAWIPNIFYAGIAFILYKMTPK
jgi:lipopolysaccharide export system permease protein